jgi:hypothetical protein
VILSLTSPLLGRGALIGEVDITGQSKNSKSAWATSGQNHILLANPKAYKNPIPMRGALGLFRVNVQEELCQ